MKDFSAIYLNTKPIELNIESDDNRFVNVLPLKPGAEEMACG